MLTPLASAPRSRPPRVIIYARVSRDSGEGRSVSQQLSIGRRTAQENGWQVVGEYSDNDRSASRYATRQREEWSKVEDAIRAGDADVLWIWEISRGTRDMVVWAQLAAVCQENRMHIALDDDVWDTTKPSHMKHLSLLMVDAVYESEKNASRVNRGAGDLAEQGHPWGKPAFGYRREYDPTTGALIRQAPDPEERLVVEEIARRVEAGESPSSIASDFNRRKVPTPGGAVAGQELTHDDGRAYITRGWGHQTIVKTITRPSVMGKRSHHGRIQAEGGWEPIIEPDRWEMIRARITPAERGRPWMITHMLSGLAICDICDAHVRAFDRSRGNPAYRCAGQFDGHRQGKSHVQRAKHLLEAHVEGMLIERFSDPDVVDAFQAAGVVDPAVSEARSRLAAAQGELEELYADVEAGVVSRRMAVADEARLQRLVQELEPQTRQRATDPVLRSLVEGDPAQVWRSWGLEQRREALRVATEEIRVLKVGPVGRREVSAQESVRIVWRGVS